MDHFRDYSDSIDGPARRAAAITPSDGTALAAVSKALYVGGAGDLAVRLVDDSADCLFVAVPAGTILPIRATHVRATGTSASAIVVLG